MTNGTKTRSCSYKACRRPVFEDAKCVEHAQLAAPSVLADQLNAARQEIRDMRAELRMIEAEAEAQGVRLTWRQDELIIWIVKLLETAREASETLTSASVDTGRISGTREQPSPGGSSRLARRRVQEFRTAITDACTAFETVMENDWQKPWVDDGIPTVRCRRSGCAAQDVNVKAWREVRGGRRIYAEHCVSCGNALDSLTAYS